MDTKRIRRLLDLFPRDSSLYTADVEPANANGESHAQLINRMAYALMDPSFQWNYAMAFIKMRKRIPAEVKEIYIRHAFEFSMVDTPHVRKKYRHILMAKMFHHPTWRYHRYFLEALLIIPDLSLEEVAKFTGVDIAIVHCYENLFFNVRDRLADKLFINQIVYPKTRRVENLDDYMQNEDPGYLMMRAAYNSGVEAVLRIYGTKVGRDDSKSAVRARKLKAHVMDQALHMAETGGLNQGHSPVMKQAFKLMASSGNGAFDDREMGLDFHDLNPGQAVLYSLAGMDDNSPHQARLKIQREQKAKEPADKKQEPGQSDKLPGT